MTLLAALHGPAAFLGRLADPAIRALALAGVVGVALAAFRVRSGSARLLAWTAVLYAALAMPLLSGTLPPFTVSLPAVPVALPAVLGMPVPAIPAKEIAATPHAQTRATGSPIFIPRNETVARSSSGVLILQPPQSSAGASAGVSTPLKATARNPISWPAVALAGYFLVALALLFRFIVGLILGGRLASAASEIREARANEFISRLAAGMNLPALPRVAESAAIAVPVTLGVREPSILLPADWREWDDAKLRAVLAHELSHVARRDPLTQQASQIHRAIFWFSPLAWWLDRRLAELAEEASDEAALSGGVDRAEYARTLLGFFEALQTAPGRVWWQGVAMAKAGQAERRVDRILAWKGAVTMGLRKSIVVLIVALCIPVLYLTAGIRPNILAPQESAAPPAKPAVPIAPHAKAVPAPSAAPSAVPAPSAAPVAAAAPDADATPSASSVPIGRVAPIPAPAGLQSIAPSAQIAGPATIAPVAPAAPIASMSPLPGTAPYGGVTGGVQGGVVAPAYLYRGYGFPQGQSSQSGSSASTTTARSSADSYSYEDRRGDGPRYVIVSGSSDSVTMSGSSEDAEHARALRKKIPGDFIWFERDEKPYVIRDQATIDRARKLFEPQEELGKQQEELGAQQEALGKQQEALGKKMEEVRVKVPDMTADLEKLKAELKALQDGGTQEQLGELQSEIAELQSKVGELQSNAGDMQSKLGEEMGKLGEQQSELGEQQGKLGEMQGELARRASQGMKALFDEAIAKGLAQPEP
jgi:beta-lactamase regulating signal transducer with metallopeptidase domain